VRGSSVEGFHVASNGGKDAAISEASSIDEFNSYKTVGMLSKQEHDSVHAWKDNAAYSEEDCMVMEARHVLFAKEDNLMFEDGFKQIDATEASG